MVTTRLAPRFFRQQAGHDVVFVVVGQGAEYVDFVDVFFVQQRFIGGAALQNEGVVEVFGEPLGAAGVVFDDFDVVFGFELLGEAVADVAAAGNHHAAGALFQRPQFMDPQDMALMELRNIRKSYRMGQNELEVLHGISMRIAPREFIAMMRPSGLWPS